MKLRWILPFLIGSTISFFLGLFVWKYFFFVFSFFGLVISLGMAYEEKAKKIDQGRRISILLIGLVFIVFFGFMQHENMQIEEVVVYSAYFLTAGVFTRVLIHYAIAKVLGPLIWGRGYCGWACWTAALLEWLPIKENRKIPAKLTHLRYPVLLISLTVPFLIILGGYDFLNRHVLGNSDVLIQRTKIDQFLWFVAGNALYYLCGVLLAFSFRKRRAFCKIACPVSLVMKIPASFAIVKKKPTGNSCIGCGTCSRNCPMDIDVQAYMEKGQPVLSTECILCGVCGKVCPVKAIA